MNYFLNKVTKSMGARWLWDESTGYANNLVTRTTSSSGILFTTCADIDSIGEQLS